MKALSLNQPWAELVVSGHKTIETRRWKTSFRGPFYIHASKTCNADIVEECKAMLTDGELLRLNYGALIGTANLVDVKTYNSEEAFHVDINKHLVNFDSVLDFGTVRYGFILTDIKRLEQPIPCRGMLNFFEPKPAERTEERGHV